MAEQKKRKAYLVKSDIQNALLMRVIRYWILSLFVVGGLTFLGWMFVYPGLGSIVGPDALLSKALPVLLMSIVAALMLLPVALRDLARFSNRFVGPMVRMQRMMESVAEGEPAQQITLREGDFWKDFADKFNQVLDRVESIDADQHAATSEGESSPFEHPSNECDAVAVEA